MSATAKARQEARRRKILENADKRMKILTNQYDKDNDENSTENKDISGNAIKEEVFKARLKAKKDNQENKKDVFKTEDTVKTSECNEKKVSGHSESQTIRHRGTSKVQTNIDYPQTDRITSSNGTQELESTDSDPNAGLKQLEALKIASFVLLAMMCRLVLKTGFGMFYFQSIFLPFIAVEVGWIHYQLTHALSVPRKKNKMSTVLLLCGIKPDLLVVYDSIMNYVATFSEDFALFTFSFFISNFLVS